MKSYLTIVWVILSLLLISCVTGNENGTSSDDSGGSGAGEEYISQPNDEKADSITLEQYIKAIKDLHLDPEDEMVLLDTSTTRYLDDLGRQSILNYWIERASRPENIIEGINIVQGTSQSIYEAPFMVGIQDINGDFQCGGTIIADRWILTAAHCFQDLDSKWDIRFLIGTHLNTNCGDTLRVDSLHSFPGAASGFHDIALIELVNPLNLSRPNISKIQIPQQGENVAQVGETVHVAGWGWTGSAGPLSKNLLKGALVLSSLDACQNEDNCVLNDTHLVTQNAKVDICAHDSGGPLYKEVNRNGTMIKFQVGIVQQNCTGHCGDSTCNKFVNLARYRNWIDMTIANNPPSTPSPI